ncbi:MAG: hypothetical protein RL755_1779 [Pseudomonadota bacterium]|jgi:CBS domain-containing membrane protein
MLTRFYLNNLVRYRIVQKLAKLLPTSPHLSIQYQLVSVIDSFLCIIAIVISANYFMDAHSPILLAPMGASVVILLFAPHSPFAGYWSFLGGHITSACIGIACAMYITPFSFASALAVSGSISVMLLLRCLHPPGAATALVPVISHQSSLMNADSPLFLFPVLYNLLVMLLMVSLINRYFLIYKANHAVTTTPTQASSLSQQDVQRALLEENELIDVNLDKLHELLLNAEKQKVKRLHSNITCGDIMKKNITTVEYSDEVEMAWQKIHHQKINAMPVVDKKNHVIGMVTWANFLQFIDMSPYSHFQDRLMTFIRRTPDTTSQKPEFVGHIMTKNVLVLSEKASITHLIDLFSTQNYKQIPIINDEKKLVGMVYQSDLINALNDVGNTH